MLGASRLHSGASRRQAALRAACCYAAQQRAASQHSYVLLHSTATCCFAAQLRAASQHSVAWCAQPPSAALRAATLHLHAMPRTASIAALRAAHAASQHACKCRNCGKSPHARGFCGRHQVKPGPNSQWCVMECSTSSQLACMHGCASRSVLLRSTNYDKKELL